MFRIHRTYSEVGFAEARIRAGEMPEVPEEMAHLPLYPGDVYGEFGTLEEAEEHVAEMEDLAENKGVVYRIMVERNGYLAAVAKNPGG